MSCTVLTVPYALAWVIGLTVAGISNIVSNIPEEHRIDDSYKEVCNDIHVVTEKDFLEKNLETPFVDKEILIKTLKEHGCQGVVEENGKIVAQLDTYSMTFERYESDKPYFLKISYSPKNNLDEKIDEINSEYAMNVQESSYLSIIEKLKENNLQIEEEEVLEDNTIVLTVNLEG